MSLSRIHLKHFTTFDTLGLDLSPGVNVLIGANATGKTHLMKVAYAACDITKTRLDFVEKLVRVFLPSGRALGRLLKRRRGSSRGMTEIFQGRRKLRASFTNHAIGPESAKVTGAGSAQQVVMDFPLDLSFLR